MMRHRISNMILLPMAAAIFLLTTVISSCERKPLYLRASLPADVKISVYDIQLDMLWGFDWRTEWQYDWDSTKYGPIGYTVPEWVRATIYNRDYEAGKRVSSFTRNFDKHGGRVSLTSASWYDMLFYNSGTEYILFNPAVDYSTYYASTRPSSAASYSRAFSRQLPDYNQPDELLGLLMPELYVSDDPNDYEIAEEEDGTIVYLYKLDAIMRPYTFIYLVQVMMLNNTDSVGQRVVGCEGMTVGGVSQGTDLFTRFNFADESNITSDDVKPIERDRYLTLPDGTKTKGDIFACRMLSWGLPNMAPLVVRSEATLYSSNGNELGLGLKLRNGANYNVTRDVTEQMEKHPTGGVITVVFDSSEIPDSIFRPKPNPEGGGFNATVENWGNEFNAEIEI